MMYNTAGLVAFFLDVIAPVLAITQGPHLPVDTFFSQIVYFSTHSTLGRWLPNDVKDHSLTWPCPRSAPSTHTAFPLWLIFPYVLRAQAGCSAFTPCHRRASLLGDSKELNSFLFCWLFNLGNSDYRGNGQTASGADMGSEVSYVSADYSFLLHRRSANTLCLQSTVCQQPRIT